MPINKEVKLETKDGLFLLATVYSPTTPARAGVVINSATAVRQGYYQKFAQFLADNGFQVVTYDYRGIGGSAINNSRDKRLTMENWGSQDLASIINWVSHHYPELDWHCIGHSVGGQILGLAPNNTVFNSVYCVSAQSGYWAHWLGESKARMFAMWYAVVPALSTLFGKVPGLFLGGESLPEHIAKQWAYWGRHPDYIVDKQKRPMRDGFQQMHCEMKFMLVDDDLDFAPPAAVRSLASFYSNAKVDIEVIDTHSLGSKLGHFGFFRDKHKSSLWVGALEWLQAHSSDNVQHSRHPNSNIERASL